MTSMVTAPSASALFLCLLVCSVFGVHGLSNGQQQQQQQQLQSELQDSSMASDERWYTMPKPMNPTSTTTKEIADQRYHPVPTPESQVSPALLRLLLLNQSLRGGKDSSAFANKRNYRTAALAATIHRKIRAEGENMANMLGMLKKMEECMKMTEGLRFRKRSISEEELQGNFNVSNSTPEDIYQALVAGKRADSGHRIRALKNLCQM